MKVLHFFKTSFPDSMGGTEQVIHQLASGCGKFGVDIEVLSLSSGSDTSTLHSGGYLTHRAKLNFEIASTGFSISAFTKFANLAKQFDVIHYHFPWPFMDLVHFATGINKPTVVTYHSDIVRQKSLLKLYQPLKKRFLASVDSIVATSPNYFATSDVLARFSDKVTVIPIGIDKATYQTPSSVLVENWRSKFSGRFFLFVGMLRYYKGLHILLDALRGMNYPVVIIGSGPVETELKEHAARLGLQHVHFLGALPDVDKVVLLQLCYAVVFPSHLRSEAFGISLLEGAMFGKPMISSEIGTGTTFINIAGETGLVVPPSNPEALREAMKYLWNHPDVAAEMGKRAEVRYWTHFTAEKMCEEYSNLYQKVLASSAKV